MGFPPKHIELAGTVTVGPKGQIVIPAEYRERMKIHPGDKLVALYITDKNAIGFVSEESMQSMINDMGEHLKALQTKLRK